MHIVCQETPLSIIINPYNKRNIGVLTFLFDTKKSNTKPFNMIDFRKKDKKIDLNMENAFYETLKGQA